MVRGVCRKRKRHPQGTLGEEGIVETRKRLNEGITGMDGAREVDTQSRREEATEVKAGTAGGDEKGRVKMERRKEKRVNN